MGEEDIKKIIGFGKPCDKCKECYEFKHKGCRGMSQICFGYHKEKEKGLYNALSHRMGIPRT